MYLTQHGNSAKPILFLVTGGVSMMDFARQPNLN